MKYLRTLICLVAVAFVITWAGSSKAEDIVIGFSGPLSGPAAEYGQDCVNGIDMAVKELNAAGGVTVKGKKYTFKLEKLDDRVDPTQAKNNALRFVNQDKAIAVFNPIATTIGPIMSIPEHNFIIAAYSSVHMVNEKGHPMVINPVPSFANYAVQMANAAWDRGWRKAGMVVTLGGYGEAWRTVFKNTWIKKGGTIVSDFPANLYTETDYSAQLTAALAPKPDFLLVGGPSSTTALLIEQARGMGFKGGLVLIDQAKPDYIAKTLKNMKLLEGMISTVNIADVPLPALPGFQKKYTQIYKKDITSECTINYSLMHIIARSIAAANSLDAKVVRQNIYKVLPLLGDRFPGEYYNIQDNGVINQAITMQYVKDGKFSKPDICLTFPKTKAEYEKIKKISKITEPGLVRWEPMQF
jgi:branched-chain amino acid transport system substrate-binding protein